MRESGPQWHWTEGEGDAKMRPNYPGVCTLLWIFFLKVFSLMLDIEHIRQWSLFTNVCRCTKWIPHASARPVLSCETFPSIIMSVLQRLGLKALRFITCVFVQSVNACSVAAHQRDFQPRCLLPKPHPPPTSSFFIPIDVCKQVKHMQI